MKIDVLDKGNMTVEQLEPVYYKGKIIGWRRKNGTDKRTAFG